MNILKFVPIFLLFGTIALYSTRIKHKECATANNKSCSILLKAKGYGKQKDAAIENAEISAIKAILFKGVPGSHLPTPLVPNEIKSLQIHEKYYSELLENKRYRNFISGSKSAKLSNSSLGAIDLDILVNVDALKKDLAENKVISI